MELLQSLTKEYCIIQENNQLKEVDKKGCDSVLLGTQKGYPSHRFYLKNGFEEIEDAVLLFYEPAEVSV